MKYVARNAGALAVALSLTALLSSTVTASADDPVRLVVGTSTLNVAYPIVTLPQSLGYWSDEGIDVEVLTSGGTLQAVQLLVGGGADFVEGNVSAFLQGISQNQLPLRVLAAHGNTDWRFVVPKGSDITDAKSLAGKRLGMVSLSSGGMPLLKSYLTGQGVDPESVEVVPVGFGAAPVEAFRRGEVDALLYWGSAVAGFANAGLTFDSFAPKEWQAYPDYSLATTNAFATERPEVAVKLARGMMKASLFARTNPDCAVELFWRDHPDAKSQGPDEATSKAWDLNLLAAQTETYTSAIGLYDEEHAGGVTSENWEKMQDYLQANGLIADKIPEPDFLVQIPDFISQINDFDKAAVIAQAKECKL